MFDGRGSSDPDGDPLSFDWDFGDGSPHSHVANPAHVYASEGLYTATLSVDALDDTLALGVTVQASAYRSKSRNTPFDGWTLRGRPVATFLDGRRIQLP